MKKHYLLTPGPTPVPKEIAKTIERPIIHHRTAEYKALAKTVNENLKKIFKTKNNVLTLTSSGTGAMEASVVNVLSKGDTAIVIRGGKFGERFAEICVSYGVKVVPIDIEWGTAPEPSLIEKALRENPDTRAVFIQLCETSTATVYDIRQIAGIVKKTKAILIVDAISGLGADEFNMDEWGVDIAIGGSQKAFMIPPGLSFCAVSKKAWSMIKESTLPKYYYDFNKYEQLVDKGDSPWTPAITLVIGLQKAFSMIAGVGVDNFIKRHAGDAEFVRKHIKDLGLKLFSKSPSDAVTAIKIPEGVDAAKLINSLKSKGVTFAGGQGTLKGKIFRIAHMGSIVRADLEYALGKLKETLGEQKWQ
ncbi:MAG: alanine--glyoxylate aminotransferase family protein [Candidatus Omnitrophota bacterium]|nr:MAG: alanine--glyoxylate aminotransferase family protein [Candidatus Omnitrophota bacterium]